MDVQDENNLSTQTPDKPESMDVVQKDSMGRVGKRKTRKDKSKPITDDTKDNNQVRNRRNDKNRRRGRVINYDADESDPSLIFKTDGGKRSRVSFRGLKLDPEFDKEALDEITKEIRKAKIARPKLGSKANPGTGQPFDFTTPISIPRVDLDDADMAIVNEINNADMSVDTTSLFAENTNEQEPTSQISIDFDMNMGEDIGDNVNEQEPTSQISIDYDMDMGEYIGDNVNEQEPTSQNSIARYVGENIADIEPSVLPPIGGKDLNDTIQYIKASNGLKQIDVRPTSVSSQIVATIDIATDVSNDITTSNDNKYANIGQNTRDVGTIGDLGQIGDMSQFESLVDWQGASMDQSVAQSPNVHLQNVAPTDQQPVVETTMSNVDISTNITQDMDGVETSSPNVIDHPMRLDQQDQKTRLEEPNPQPRIYKIKDVISEIKQNNEYSRFVSTPTRAYFRITKLKDLLPTYEYEDKRINVATHLQTGYTKTQFRTFMLNETESVNLQVLTDAKMFHEIMEGTSAYDKANIYVLYALVVNYVRNNKKNLSGQTLSPKIIDFLNVFLYDELYNFFGSLQDSDRNTYDYIGNILQQFNTEYDKHISDQTTPNNFMNPKVESTYLTTSYYVLREDTKPRIKHTNGVYSSVFANTNISNITFYATETTQDKNQFYVIPESLTLDTTGQGLLVKYAQDRYVKVHAYKRTDTQNSIFGGNIPLIPMNNQLVLHINESKGNMIKLDNTSVDVIKSSISNSIKRKIHEQGTLRDEYVFNICYNWLKMIATNVKDSALKIYFGEDDIMDDNVPYKNDKTAKTYILLTNQKYIAINYKASDFENSSEEPKKASWITFVDIEDMVIFVRKWIDICNNNNTHVFYIDNSSQYYISSGMDNKQYITFIAQLSAELEAKSLIDMYEFAKYQIV